MSLKNRITLFSPYILLQEFLGFFPSSDVFQVWGAYRREFPFLSNDVGADGRVDRGVLSDGGEWFSAAREEDDVGGWDEGKGGVGCRDEGAGELGGEKGCQLSCP